MSNPRQGPFIQELFIHERSTRRRLVDEAIDVGATAIGVVPWEPFQQKGATQPFAARDLRDVKNAHFRRIRQLVRWCSRHDVRVYLYGMMGPWLRRGDVAGFYKFNGEPLLESDLRAFRGRARDAILRYLQRMGRFVERLEADVVWVDGVEPFFGPHRAGPPPNEYQLAVQEVLPGALQYVAQGQWGQTAAAAGQEETDVRRPFPETHVDPGHPDRSGHGGGVLATDGWGSSDVEWPMPDGRTLRFAALPPGKTRKEVVAYFADLYRDAAAMQRDALLVLHTAQWETPTMHATPRRGIVAVDVDPWGAIYRRLRTLQQMHRHERIDRIPDAEIEFLHGDRVGSWPVTSRIASVRIDPSASIEIRHSKGGRWPAHNGVEGNNWVVAKIDGRWLAWTWEWMRPAQAFRHVPAHELGPRAKLPAGHPLAGAVHGWQPSAGELVGFFVSTHARHGGGTVDERTEIATVEWPG